MATYEKSVNQYYDLTTDAYRLYYGEHFHLFFWEVGESRKAAMENTNEIFLADANLPSGPRVVGLGCGIGSLALLVAKRFECEVTGVNINQYQLEVAEKRVRRSKLPITLVHQDVMHLDLDGVFDAAFMIDVECHFPDKQLAIRNVAAVLGEKGRIVMTAWLKDEAPNWIQEDLLLRPFCRAGRFPSLGTFSAYEEIFKQEGLRIIKFEDTTAKSSRSLDAFYYQVFEIMEEFGSKRRFESLMGKVGQVGDAADLRADLGEVFLPAIYGKLCMDAGVYKLGYFVLEKGS